jgi:hypothetical protein
MIQADTKENLEVTQQNAVTILVTQQTSDTRKNEKLAMQTSIL